MLNDIGLTPDPPRIVYRHLLRLFPDEDADMIHEFFLPDGYNCHTDGLGIVVTGDTNQAQGTAHSRDLVKINVYGPDHDQVRRVGRAIYTALTQGVTGIGLGVSLSQSTFFGSGPSYTPTGFVSTMSVSVGIGRFFMHP